MAAPRPQVMLLPARSLWARVRAMALGSPTSVE
jgi:hypothetical protein